MPTTARLISPLFAAMAVLLTAGLAGAFASGFGAPVPTPAVLVAIGGGTFAMVELFVCMIAVRLRHG